MDRDDSFFGYGVGPWIRFEFMLNPMMFFLV